MPFEDFPTTLPEFERRFADEVACAEYLRTVKWPGGFRCPKCGGDRSYWVCERGREQCAACRHQTSVTSGTMFHKTRTPLKVWFRAIFEFVSAKHGCSALHLSRILGLSYETAWTWLHKIRDVLVRQDREPLAGVVEADETYIGGPEPGCPGRARGENKLLIAGAVEVRGEACGRSRLRPVDDAGAEQLQTFVADVVEQGAVVKTDGLPSYDGLDAVFDHKVSVIGRDPKRAAKLFPKVHRVFSLFRRVILGTYHGSWSRKWAAQYCEEFAFRFNRRNSSSRTHLFRRVIEQSVRRASRIHLLARRDYEEAVLAA
jgi:transposase-like protein